MSFIVKVQSDCLQVFSRDEIRVYLMVAPDGILPERQAIEYFINGVGDMVLSLMGYNEEAHLE